MWENQSKALAIDTYMCELDMITCNTITTTTFFDIQDFFTDFTGNVPLYAQMALMPDDQNPCDSLTVEKYEHHKEHPMYQLWLKLITMQRIRQNA